MKVHILGTLIGAILTAMHCSGLISFIFIPILSGIYLAALGYFFGKRNAILFLVLFLGIFWNAIQTMPSANLNSEKEIAGLYSSPDILYETPKNYAYILTACRRKGKPFFDFKSKRPLKILITVSKKRAKLSPSNYYYIKGKPTVLNHLNFQEGFNLYLQSRGVFIKVKIDSLLGITKASGGFVKMVLPPNNVQKAWIENPLLAALLVGDKSQLLKKQKTQFKELGLSHLLAVSGFHVGVICLLIRVVLYGFRPWYSGRWVMLYINLLLLVLYCMLCGFSPSILRATLMISFVLVGRMRGGNLAGKQALFWAVCFCLLLKPLWIIDIGFQLSIFAVYGILSGLQWTSSFFSKERKLVQYLLTPIIVGATAHIYTLPLVLFYFKIWYPIGFFYSLIATPLTACLMYVGIFGLVCLELGFIGWSHLHQLTDLYWTFLNGINQMGVLEIHLIFDSLAFVISILFLLYIGLRSVNFRMILAGILLFSFLILRERVQRIDEKQQLIKQEMLQ